MEITHERMQMMFLMKCWRPQIDVAPLPLFRIADVVRIPDMPGSIYTVSQVYIYEPTQEVTYDLFNNLKTNNLLWNVAESKLQLVSRRLA